MKNEKRKKWVIGTMIAAIIIGLFCSIAYWSKQQAKVEESSKAEISTKLLAISDYLTKLDKTVVENQGMVGEVISSEESYFTLLQKEVTTLSEVMTETKERFEKYKTLSKSDSETTQENILLIQEKLEESKEQIRLLETSVKETLSQMERSAKDRQTILEGRIIELKELLEKNQEALKETEKVLTEAILNLQKEGQEQHQEGILFLQEMKEVFLSEMEKQTEKIELSFFLLTNTLLERLQELHGEIQLTQKNITVILNGMEENNQKNQMILEKELAAIEEAIEGIKQSMEGMYEEIKQLIQNLQEKGNENHAKTIEKLMSVERNVQGDLANHLSKITDSFSELNTGVEQNFTQLNQSLNQKDGQLRLFLETNMTNLNQRLDVVFQSVSSGKSNLASALLTKGVEIKEDATFAEMKEAILKIRQQLVIGVEKLPGTIRYDYHYHTDRNGNMPHVTTNPVSGGCYTIPVYHVHIKTCYSTTQCGGRTEKKEYMTEGCRCGPNANGGTNCSNHGCYFEPPSAMYPSGCAQCFCPKSREQICTVCGAKNSGSTCTSNKTILSCPKNGSSIEHYRIGCALNDGQIIAAHIEYIESAVRERALMIAEEVREEYVPKEDFTDSEGIEVWEKILVPEEGSEVSGKKPEMSEEVIEEEESEVENLEKKDSEEESGKVTEDSILEETDQEVSEREEDREQESISGNEIVEN